MSISLNTNLTSIIARRNLGDANEALKQNIERLSTGKRINSASDDPAGLAVSENMQADIRSLAAAKQNANDGVSMAETAEGALSETQDILNRMKELATEANTDALNSGQRDNIQKEFKAMKAELSDISQDTEFNGTTLLATGFAAQIQVGKDAADQVTVALGQGVSPASLGVAAEVVSGARTNASSAVGAVQTAINDVSKIRANLGAQVNRLDIKMDNIGTEKQNLEAANSRIRDTDVAKETAELAQNQILVQASTSMLSQANSSPQTALSLLGGGA